MIDTAEQKPELQRTASDSIKLETPEKVESLSTLETTKPPKKKQLKSKEKHKKKIKEKS